MLPFEVAKNTSAPWRYMSISLFFNPNAFFYGQPGWGSVILVNHALWFIGLSVWVIKFFTPWVDPIPQETHKRVGIIWGRVLVAVSLLFSILAFYYLYTMRHAQYLMPIAIFIAFYLSVLVVNSWQRVSQRVVGSVVFFLVYLIATSGLLVIGITWHKAKLTMTNTDAQNEMRLLWRIVPSGAYMFDLDCRSLYYQDPYPISCLQFGDFALDVSRPLPPIQPYLERSHTSYIYVDSLGRLDSLPERDRTYIRNNFSPHPAYLRVLVRNP